ncbi:P-II family nitrogen regulator [Methanolobus halotolerans]|uniref:Nitrogen fixation protein NifHD n=1 Tax=Methanolobus halotolerans TaxID=2052935 RepID=A0A4E0QS78_9EURY|nr:P-II family nitrogen regulator [Methanolobus halotolerans]TGC09748.1 nitrogen fixation protein NifHD [Methanolobus halotolerans]
MKEITAIIRMNKVHKTLDALSECGYPSFTVEKVMGRGKQKGLCYEFDPPLPEQEGVSSKNCIPFIPKRLFTIVVDDKAADKIVQRIITINQTGHAGDGKIFVTDIPESYRIRTGEEGNITVEREEQ